MNLATCCASPLAAIRAAYFIEVEALANHLRPRFESGGLRAWRRDETGELVDLGEQFALEHAVADALGLDPERHQGAERNALIVLLAHLDAPDSDAGDLVEAARIAAGEDVVRYARRWGWCGRPALSVVDAPPDDQGHTDTVVGPEGRVRHKTVREEPTMRTPRARAASRVRMALHAAGIDARVTGRGPGDHVSVSLASTTAVEAAREVAERHAGMFRVSVTGRAGITGVDR
ncbi:MAG TPA: hypothetical protein VFG53_08275 [Anaeromyxobacter sp.]|nr:hypothetical protein [Anaeromyxobacter sp.]